MINRLPANAPSPRLCLVQKSVTDQEYGFNLHAEKNKSQYVGAVDLDSPAERGGLRKGDRILGVNGVLIENETHKEVVQRIKSNLNRCELLVIDEEDLKWYENHGISVSYDLPHIVRPTEVKFFESHTCCTASSAFNQTYVSTARIELRSQHKSDESDENNDKEQTRTTSTRGSVVSIKQSASISAAAQAVRPAPLMSPRPLLCHLRKQRPTDEFGFNLHAERNKGHFIGVVDQGGIADCAGLETGQRIVGVNGELVYPTSQHKEVVSLIKRDPLDTRLLVASEEVDRWYAENGIPYSFDLAIVHESVRSATTTAQSRSATVSSHQTTTTNGVMPQSHQTSGILENDAAYVPGDLLPSSAEGQEEIAVKPTEALTASLDSASKLIEELQDVENAAAGIEAEDLLEQVFSCVKPPEVKAIELREQNRQIDARVAAQTLEEKHTITNYKSAPLTVSPSNFTSGSSTNHHNHYHATPPSVTYMPASQFGTNMSSPQSDKRSLDSPDSHKDENVDIFKLSAKEARQMMRQRRKDPRLQTNMTLEEKHHLIANL